MSDDILEMIDSAIDDFEVGVDAMRCNAPEASRSSATRPTLEPRYHWTLPGVFTHTFGTISPLIVSFDEAADLFFMSFAESLEGVTRAVTYATASTERFTYASISADHHLLMVQTCKAFKVRPHELGIVHPGCACHSHPFPAARDYRRRTRHRNRRK